MRNLSARWWVIFLLFSGTFVNAIDRAALSTAVPSIIKDLKIDEREMGVALSAFFWLYMIMNIPAGAIADKVGAKRTLGWAAVLWSVCSAGTGWARNFSHILLARVGVGMGEAATYPVNTKIVNCSFRRQERGMAVGYYTSGLRLGFAVTPILMAWLILHFGWRAAFYVTGLGSLGWVALWYFTYRENLAVEGAPHPAFGHLLPEGEGSRSDASVEKVVENGGSKPARIPWRQLLQNRTVVGLVLCKFFQDYLFYLFVTWLPGYLVLERKFTIVKMGWYASLPWIAGFIAQPLVGLFSDLLIRNGWSVTLSRKSLIIAMQILAASVVLAGFVQDAITAVWILTFSVACESAATALLWTACTDVAPARSAGSLAGIMNSAGALAGILAPTVTGFLVHATGSFQQGLLIGSCMVIVAAGAMAFVVKRLEPLSFQEETSALIAS